MKAKVSDRANREAVLRDDLNDAGLDQLLSFHFR